MGKRPIVILCKTARAPPDLPAALTPLEGRAALTEAAAALCAALGGLHSANTLRNIRVVEHGRCHRARSSAALAATATAAHAGPPPPPPPPPGK